ncbi:hypothetical protein ASPACDRAFT_46374 [Aspergillus aculeatus ATCC 16872]|uniref:Uncharacterized protein n=1 Tax=Aspergillus aculeatus (strain ATCC 16872 / CBS 172.66 / WB 5094) TaxID=690307 RepID=A0A1L9WL19_ASPA1|nr:uncharacterized protein ASPACDRAFT_46374 [Aspergillus aculeatus ATCC 16872]OJJ96849.1 hypothetical protein ASPACDRAFT_46374 [Aspergillus aculeatus ATCC 16872]
MCEQVYSHYAGCNHLYRTDIQWCAAAQARPKPQREPCQPAKDLPMVLSKWERDNVGLCDRCLDLKLYGSLEHLRDEAEFGIEAGDVEPGGI